MMLIFAYVVISLELTRAIALDLKIRDSGR
jgi:hypothetical protein